MNGAKFYYHHSRIGARKMAKPKSVEAKIQSEIDNMKEAQNSVSGFKNTVSSGTHGAGDSFRNKR